MDSDRHIQFQTQRKVPVRFKYLQTRGENGFPRKVLTGKLRGMATHPSWKHRSGNNRQETATVSPLFKEQREATTGRKILNQIGKILLVPSTGPRSRQTREQRTTRRTEDWGGGGGLPGLSNRAVPIPISCRIEIYRSCCVTIQRSKCCNTNSAKIATEQHFLKLLQCFRIHTKLHHDSLHQHNFFFSFLSSYTGRPYIMTQTRRTSSRSCQRY